MQWDPNEMVVREPLVQPQQIKDDDHVRHNNDQLCD